MWLWAWQEFSRSNQGPQRKIKKSFSPTADSRFNQRPYFLSRQRILISPAQISIMAWAVDGYTSFFPFTTVFILPLFLAVTDPLPWSFSGTHGITYVHVAGHNMSQTSLKVSIGEYFLEGGLWAEMMTETSLKGNSLLPMSFLFISTQWMCFSELVLTTTLGKERTR